MKKTFNLLSIIFAVLTLVCALLAPITEGFDAMGISGWVIIGIIVLSSASFVVLSLLRGQNKIVALVPILLLYTVFNCIQNLAQVLLAEGDIDLVISPTTNFDTLNLLLLIVFIVATVFALKDGSKWASIVGIAYTALMLVSLLNLLFALLVVSDVLSGMEVVFFTLVAMLFALATQVVFYASLEGKKKQTPTEATSEQKPDEQ